MSNAERIKPLIMQTATDTNYRMCLVKKLWTKWQGNCWDHKSFEEKYVDTNNAVDVWRLKGQESGNQSWLAKKDYNLEPRKNEIQHKMNVLTPHSRKIVRWIQAPIGREKNTRRPSSFERTFDSNIHILTTKEAGSSTVAPVTR
jgi:hypothetical protein